MRPVVFALDHVCSITAAPAETPHETWFQQTYGNAIISALERLKNPANPANPASSWLPFKQVCRWVGVATCKSLYINGFQIHLHRCGIIKSCIHFLYITELSNLNHTQRGLDQVVCMSLGRSWWAFSSVLRSERATCLIWMRSVLAWCLWPQQRWPCQARCRHQMLSPYRA